MQNLIFNKITSNKFNSNSEIYNMNLNKFWKQKKSYNEQDGK